MLACQPMTRFSEWAPPPVHAAEATERTERAADQRSHNAGREETGKRNTQGVGILGSLSWERTAEPMPLRPGKARWTAGRRAVGIFHRLSHGERRDKGGRGLRGRPPGGRRLRCTQPSSPGTLTVECRHAHGKTSSVLSLIFLIPRRPELVARLPPQEPRARRRPPRSHRPCLGPAQHRCPQGTPHTAHFEEGFTLPYQKVKHLQNA